MKNRTLPYGYQCCNGITVLHPQESEIVKRICESYLNGQSLLTIATWLNEEQIEYMPGVIGWNKARLKRLIEDERYLGKEISLKECYETEYWIEIAQKASIISEDVAKSVLHDCGSIRRMLIASINTAKEGTK